MTATNTDTIHLPAMDVVGLDKLKELILYVAEQSKDDPRFASVKLNKILYWSDFEAYRRYGHSITGAEYQHLKEGPAPRHLLPARRELMEEDALVLVERPHFGRVQMVPQVKRLPNLTMFQPEEIELVDEVLAMLRDLNGREVSDLSHLEWGWRLTSEGDTIEYRTAWLSPEPLTQDQVQRAQKLAASG